MLVKNSNVVLRTVHESIFLIDVSDNYSCDKCSLYEINETGKFLWNNMGEKYTIDNLAKALQKVIVDDVPYDTLYCDVLEYVEELKSKRFVLEVEKNG